MIRFLLQRFLLLIFRLFLSALAILALIEVGFVLFGNREENVWEISFGSRAPEALGGDPWWELLSHRSSQSLVVLLISFGGALLVGYSWGILAARFRKFRASVLLVFPWSLFACVPAFWFVVGVAIFSYFRWERPGFANDLVVESGPDILLWWNAAVVALPLLAVAASWQIRAVLSAVGKEASQPFVKGLFLAGYRDEDIFYANILKRSRRGLAGLLDRTLPATLGGMIVSEWAFRYEGVGSLLVDSVLAGSYAGIFLSGMWMASTIGTVTFVREWIVQVPEGGRES